jgi:hypothetical protein
MTGQWSLGLGVVLTALSTLGLAPASGQTVRGVILDEGANQRINGAVVSVLPAATDTVLFRRIAVDGLFEMLLPDSGRYRVQVQALGYRAVRFPVELGLGSVVTLEVKLSHEAIALEPVRVVAERAEPLYMKDVRRRQAQGFGRFLSREQIDEQLGVRLDDLLRSVPGIRLANYNAGARLVPLVVSRVPNVAGDCFATIYVNGSRVLELPTGPPDVLALEKADDLFSLSSSQVEAIEVYRGAAEVPAEFGGATARCGVVAVWLRAGH